MSDIKDWAVSAGGNTAATPDGWPEGQLPSTVNNCAREMMAGIARQHRLADPFYTATYTAATNISYIVDRTDISLAYSQGLRMSFIAPIANTGTANLQYTGLASYPLKYRGSHLTSSAILTNSIVEAVYNATGPHFDILSALARDPGTYYQYKVGTFTRNIALTANQSITGVGFKPKFIIFLSGLAAGASAFSIGISDATTNAQVRDNYQDTANTYITSTTACIGLMRGASDVSSAVVLTMDADGFTLDWTNQGSPTGTATIIYLAIG